MCGCLDPPVRGKMDNAQRQCGFLPPCNRSDAAGRTAHRPHLVPGVVGSASVGLRLNDPTWRPHRRRAHDAALRLLRAGEIAAPGSSLAQSWDEESKPHGRPVCAAPRPSRQARPSRLVARRPQSRRGSSSEAALRCVAAWRSRLCPAATSAGGGRVFHTPLTFRPCRPACWLYPLPTH